MEEPTDTIVEEREEHMVSLSGNTKPVLRTAHFLKPTVTAIDEHVAKAPSLSAHCLPPKFEPKKWPIKVTFKGWRYPQKDWTTWVDYLRPKFQSLWKQAGIFEAILCSTFHIQRDDKLIIGIAEKWCPVTNTMVFPWAEATITLEDVMILGGYSVLGSPVPRSVERQDLKEIEGKLKKARTNIAKCPANFASMTAWLKKFMKSGSEIEHEAFLSFWIARFVFPDSYNVIKRHVFPIAIHLARGTRIALGPAVLASIYKDLRFLKEAIVASTKFENDENGYHSLGIDLWSPLCLLQMWAFERFIELREKPNMIKCGDPRAAQWNNVRTMKVENIRLAMDSAGESFRWRPYATVIRNWRFPKFYKENEEWVAADSGLEEEILSYAICLRTSELVGLECIEQYLPNRVAMQFGMDQDLPGCVTRFNKNPEIAWRNYVRPFTETKLYLPSRFFDSDVTIRYLTWWKQSKSVQQYTSKDMTKSVVRRKRCLRTRSKGAQWFPIGMIAENNAGVPPGFHPKCNMVMVEGFMLEKKPRICNNHDSSADMQVADAKSFKGLAQGSPTSMSNNAGISTELSIKLVSNISAEIGEPARARENLNESKTGNKVSVVGNINVIEEESSSSMLEIRSLRLEAKIARLEEIVAKLQVDRFGTRFAQNIREFRP